jgi:hypothetical protein
VNSFTSAAFFAEGDDFRRFRVPGLAAADDKRFDALNRHGADSSAVRRGPPRRE